MIYFSVKNYEKFQHYRDRNPVWIKYYNSLLEDYDFSKLPDASKAHLSAIWLLASRYQNRIPWDQNWIAARISATEKVNLEILESSGFINKINDASILLAKPEQLAILETEREIEKEIDTEINSETHARPEKPPEAVRLDFEFSEFYAAYPRKVGKGQARRAYGTARKKTDHASIMAGVRRYVNDPTRKPEFTKHPSTWLNAECWADETTGRLNGGQENRSKVNGSAAGKRQMRGHMFENEPEFGGDHEQR